MNDKYKIIKLFKDNVLDKVPDTSNSNQNHDGNKGHWLEEQFGIKRNRSNLPDIYGYELKDDTQSVTTFGDWSANRYIYREGEYEHLFKGTNPVEKRDSFLKIFGNPNPKKNNRYSWSGTIRPKIGKYNEFGQKLIVTKDNDICAIYSYDKDQRLNKENIIPKELQNEDEIILAKWFGMTSLSSKQRDKCIKSKLEDKFNHKGWFKCKRDKNGVYNEICFGDKINFNQWIEWVQNGDVYFDSGMYEGNERNYSLWRASNTFWDSLIIERLNGEEINKITNLQEGFYFSDDSIHEYNFKIIDLFAGIGGSRLAFQNCGCQTVFASEIDKYAQTTYEANFGEIPYGDITQIYEHEVPDHDILVGAFPCQPFSYVGVNNGFEDTRGTLFFDIARILKSKKPRAFMLENVSSLRSHNKGNTFKTILNTLDELGYYVPEPQVLNARNFGVPQNRDRLIIVGFLRSMMKDYIDEFEYPVGDELSTRVGDMLETNVSDKYTISDEFYQKYFKKINRPRVCIFNEESPYINAIIGIHSINNTIHQGKDKKTRKLTPRECARFQGFSDDFIIPVSDTQAYRLFGNASTVPLVQAVAKQMINYMIINMK